jgi:hypothetical protein
MRYNKILLKLFLFLTLFSCEDFLDIKPLNNLSEADYYKTEQQAIETVTTCYDPLKHPGFFNLNFYFLFESFGDRAVHENPTWDLFTFDSRSTYVFDVYTYIYKGVYRVNVALDKIPGIQMNESLKKRLIAEVKFLRALYNFYLTLVFNEPPLITTTITDLNIQLSNGPKQDFYNQIVKDLTEAIPDLPVSYPPEDIGRVTKGAAYAFLGKTHLYFQHWQEAKDNLLKVKELEDAGIYGLMMPKGNTRLDYIYAFLCNFSPTDFVTPGGNAYDSENNKESVFEIQFHEGGWEKWEGGWQADGKLTTLYFGPEGYRNIVPTAEYVAQFEATPSHPAGLAYDPRRYATFYEAGDTIIFTDGSEPVAWKDGQHTNSAISQGYGWKKHFYPAHRGPDGLQNDPNNIRLIRYSDVLLMLCEADYQLNGGSTPLALECINKVRSRAGLDPLTEVTPQAIIHERDVEFGFEFSRFFDLVRWSLLPNPWVNIEVMIPNYQKGKNEYLPIPLSEINLMGGKLKQNPNW